MLRCSPMIVSGIHFILSNNSQALGPQFTPSSSPLIPPSSTHGEVVLFVGYPASGKTSLYQKVFQPAGYQHVNQDTLKTRSKCIKTVEKFIAEGSSCVVGTFIG